MKKLKYTKIITSLIVITLMLTTFSSVQAKNKKVIRVGYPLMEGLSMKDEDGNYYGYDYDYLTQIAQYTGWEYEFVEVDGDINTRLSKLMDMLKKGEIDLLGGLKYAESLTSSYDYASEPYGNGYNVIVVKNDSPLVDVDSLIHEDNLKIGVLKNAEKRVQLLDSFAQMNGIKYEKVVCENEKELYEKTLSNDIDALLSVDLNMPKDYIPIARFSPDPFYFVSTKGNAELINELNQALININKINPTFASTTYNRYFSGNNGKLVLNQPEKDFLKKTKELKVLVREGVGPIQYLKNKKAAGVGVDILEKFSKETKTKLSYVYADTYEEYIKLIKSGDIDISLGTPYEIKTAEDMNITLSDPYISSGQVLVTNHRVDPSEINNMVRASTHYNHESFDSNPNIKYYNSPEEALKAVNEEKADYAYVNTYLYTFYLNMYDFKNLSTFATPDYFRSQYSFGVPKNKDFVLLSILNKTILSQKSVMETYIYKNAYTKNSFDIKDLLQEYLLYILALIVLCAGGVIYFLRSHYNKELKMKRAVEIEYLRFQLLSDLSQEMTFSYDYGNDELKISSSGLKKIASKSSINDFFVRLNDTSESEILNQLATHLREKKDISYEIESKLLDSDEVNWFRVSIKIINDINKNNTVAVYAVGKIVNIQKEKEEHEILRVKSQTDILTGIYNRGAAQDEIDKLLVKEKTNGALIMMDLDNFKDINDTYGHIEGDSVLIETALLLTKIYSPNIVARLGGDEFVIYVSDATDDKINALCEQTLEEIKVLPSLQDKEISLSLSMGIVYSSYSKDYMTLMKRADEKLYEVKRSGRNGYRIFTN